MAEEKSKKRFTFNPWYVRAFALGFLYYPILIGTAFFFPELRSFTTENIHRQTTYIKALTLFVGLLPGVLYGVIFLFYACRARAKGSKNYSLWRIFLSLMGQFVAMLIGVAAFIPAWLLVAIPPLSACAEFIFHGL